MEATTYLNTEAVGVTGMDLIVSEGTSWFLCHLPKFTKKLGSNMSKTGVLKRLNNLIWNERINPADFETEWQSIMDEYDLNSNKWFKEMFAIRDRWIPGYFKDCHLSGLMRTTSRSEGENHFYGLVTNTDLHLIEFFSNFETAMESQRYVQRKNDHDSRYTNPELKTEFLIEKEASQIFTLTVFFEIQTEIIASMLTCYSIKVEEVDGINKFSIKDTDKDLTHLGDFEVLFMKSDCTVSCSCLRFELTGCLCRHCFYVLRMSGVEHFPNKYISRRWTKDVVPRSSRGYDMRPFPTNDGQEDLKTMIRDIYLSVDYCVDKLVLNLENLNLYRKKQREMMKEVDNDTRYLQPMTNTSFIKSMIGVEKRDEVIVKIPDGIRNKGSGPIKKMLIGEKEKAILKAKKGTRKCGRCGKYVDHNARTCQEETNLFGDK
ncbi:hypothetical protein L1887_39337 [Cichorium endivia]|nr:hypothetical protein L1887_39337 [Cichorium endivia]